MLKAAFAVLLTTACGAIAADLFAVVGTVTNMTNPRRPITAPVRMAFGEDGTCFLTISPPLIGSGTCTLTQYEEKSGHVEFISKGVPNISWSGTVNGEAAIGTYRVGSEFGSFQLAIVLQPGKNLDTISNALTNWRLPQAKQEPLPDPLVRSDSIGNGPAKEPATPVPPVVIRNPPVNSPLMPTGCLAPVLREKTDLFLNRESDNSMRTHDKIYLTGATDSVFMEILNRGHVEVHALLDENGLNQEPPSGGQQAFWLTASEPQSVQLRDVLAANFRSWKWAPASCDPSNIKAVIPSMNMVGIQPNSQYRVYILVRTLYEFHKHADGNYDATSTITLGNSPGCAQLRLMTFKPNVLFTYQSPILVCSIK